MRRAGLSSSAELLVLPAQRSKRGICYGNVVGWLAGWMTRHCIKTAKLILKLCRPPGSPIILVSSDPCADTQFQGSPFSGALNTQGGKIGDFRRKSPFISETVRDIGRWLLWNVNRMSYVTE